MKHPNHFGRWLACVLLCLLLAGCSMPGEQVQVEELLRAPKLSGDYGDVQTALNDWLGESAQLKYPMQGDLLSPFLLQDLDGEQDVFYVRQAGCRRALHHRPKLQRVHCHPAEG